MFSRVWQKGRTAIGTGSALFIVFSLLLEILLLMALLVASHILPSLDLTPVGDLLGVTGIPLGAGCIGIGIALARKWSKGAAWLILLTPVIVMLSGVVSGMLLLTNASTIAIFSLLLKHLELISFLFLLFVCCLLLSWFGGKGLWEAWHLRWRGVSVTGRIVRVWTHHLAQHSEDWDEYRALVAFTTLTGEDHSIELSRSSGPYLPGSDLPMTYDPKQPSWAVEATPHRPIRWVLGFVAGLLLYLFFCIGGLLSFAYLLVGAVLSLIGIQ